MPPKHASPVHALSEASPPGSAPPPALGTGSRRRQSPQHGIRQRSQRDQVGVRGRSQNLMAHTSGPDLCVHQPVLERILRQQRTQLVLARPALFS